MGILRWVLQTMGILRWILQTITQLNRKIYMQQMTVVKQNSSRTKPRKTLKKLLGKCKKSHNGNR